jgi:hypothetical protein
MEQVYIPKNYETLVAIRKLPQPKQQANPVMNLMMDSGMLKKRLQQHEKDSSDVTESVGVGSSSDATETTSTIPKKHPAGIPRGVNPLMASAMNSKILLKKKQQQEQNEDE